MLEFVLNTIFWTLAFYGFFELIKNILYISTYTKFKADGIYVIVAVKNQENKIEYFLHSILFKILYGKNENIKTICNLTDLSFAVPEHKKPLIDEDDEELES